MKKLLLTLFTASVLTGCFHQTVDSNDIYRAEKFCKEKSLHVVKILASFIGNEYVTCSDGKESPV
jgi:outer membrane lipoprotein SlyB